jgi:hypothetical protein
MQTVADLIAELQGLPPDLVVVTLGEHGNYTPFEGVDVGDLRYEAETTWSGEVRDVGEWLEDNEEWLEEGEECPGVPCCIIMGVN